MTWVLVAVVPTNEAQRIIAPYIVLPWSVEIEAEYASQGVKAVVMIPGCWKS